MCDTSDVQISRRRFLALSATIGLAACAGDDDSDPVSTGTPPTSGDPIESAPATSAATTAPASTEPEPTDPPTVALADDPFVFGVASGDPDGSSVVLWTRLGGGLPEEPIAVEWEFATDDGATESGNEMVDATTGHTLHVVAPAAGPGSFTFRAGGWTSPEGRSAPIDPSTTELRIAAASCQHYETGFYAAHRDIAEWGPDLVVFLGDFIYEGDANNVGGAIVRSHEGPEPMDLDGYRARYATYLTDPQLQASRATAPLVSIWDDHEVENNYAGLTDQDDADPAIFVERRAAAYRVWWENTPTRLDPPDPATPPDAPYEIYRGIDFGDLVHISVLDGRQFRSDQVSGATFDFGPPAAGWDDPSRTMLGSDQEAWIAERFASPATWNCLAQQTVLSDTRVGQSILNYDQWDGYIPARDRLLADAPANFITLTGDIHLAGIGEIGPIGAPVGIEFVTTSVSSLANVPPEFADLITTIPSIVDGEPFFRGYTRHVVTPDSWTAEYRSVTDVADPDSEVTTWKTFRVDSGTPAVTEV